MIPRSGTRFLKLWLPVLLLITVIQDVPADNRSTGIDRMVRQIEGLFPVLEGYVLAVKGNRVAIDLKRGQAIQPGDTLNLIRLGAPITHPVSKAIVGREEQDLGPLKVLEVRKNYSVAKLQKADVQALKGDVVRSVFKKMKIAVAPVQIKNQARIDARALGLQIETRLNERLRLEAPAFDFEAWLLANHLTADQVTRPENLARLRRKLKVDFILMPAVESIKNQHVLTYRLISAENGKLQKEARVLITAPPAAAIKPPKPTVQTDLRKNDKGLLKFTGKQDFDFVLVDFAVGDLTGKKRKDFVIIDDHRVLIYRYRDGHFKKIGQMLGRKHIDKFLSVDVADINGNGRDEIFVTNSLGESLSSFVLEIVPGKKGLTRIWEDTNQYFRVIRDFGGAPTLITQKPGIDEPFSPKIHSVHHKNTRYEVGNRIPFQFGDIRDITLYGVGYGGLISDKSKETLFLDNDYKLRVYSSGGRLLVISDEYFGHDPRMIEVGLKEQIAGTFIDNPDVPQPVPYKGRLQLVRHHTRKYLLVPKNHRTGSFLSKLVIIKNSSLVVLEADSEGLKKVYETGKQPGYLAGYQAVDSNVEGQKRVHVAMVADRGGFFSNKEVSTIYTYDWE